MTSEAIASTNLPDPGKVVPPPLAACGPEAIERVHAWKQSPSPTTNEDGDDDDKKAP
jgi:hypothetical protein